MSIRIEKAMKAATGVGKKSVLVTLNVRQRCDEASEKAVSLSDDAIERHQRL